MGDAEVIRELVARTPNDLERRMNGMRMRPMPLHLAVMKSQPAAMTTLLDLGANTESLDEAGFSALDLAALDGRHDLAQVLLERGAKVRLPAAVALHRTTDVEALLRRDPGTLKPGGRWGNLILRASERAAGDVIETLIRNGASVNVHDNPKTAIDSTSGYTPLHAAAWYGNVSAIDVLMKHGADVRVREEKYHGTPAGWADYSGHKEARDLILRGPIDIIEAIQYDMAQCVKAVLEEDPAALNRAFSEYGLFPLDAEAWHTPLAYAVTRGRKEIVRLLIERGVDATLRSPEDLTLSEIAQKAGHREIALILDGAAGGNEARG
jgi:ankyrin repeat protein